MEAASDLSFIATMRNSTDDGLARYWFIGVLLPVGILGIITNIMMILTLLLNSKRITPYQGILLGFSGFNLLFSCLSFAILYNILHPPTSPFTCKIVYVFRYFTKMQVFYTETLLAFMRYRASKRLVSRPVHIMTWKQFVVLYIFITVGNISLTTAKGVSDNYVYNAVLGACTFAPSGAHLAIHWPSFCAFCTACVLSCSWYGLIYHGLRTNRFQGSVHRRVERRVCRDMIIVLVLYCIMILVGFVRKLFESKYKTTTDYPFVLGAVTHQLLSAVSPLLQGMKLDEVKKIGQKCPCSKNKIGVLPNVTDIPQILSVRSSRIELEESLFTTVSGRMESQNKHWMSGTVTVINVQERQAALSHHM